MHCILLTEVSGSATLYAFALFLMQLMPLLRSKGRSKQASLVRVLRRFTPSSFRLNLHVTGSNLF
jgi:hypothetical protein